MSTAVEDVLRAALKLTPEERAELVDSLWDTLPDMAIELDPEFVAEVNRRSDEIDAGTAVGRPWSEFRKELLAELDRDV
jgi:putative addiction module component (TIGR02574 family)